MKNLNKNNKQEEPNQMPPLIPRKQNGKIDWKSKNSLLCMPKWEGFVLIAWILIVIVVSIVIVILHG